MLNCDGKYISSNFCLGCGLNLTSKKQHEKRVLSSDTTHEESKTWKELVVLKCPEFNYRDFEDDQLIGLCTNPLYMCRTCFTAYK